MDVQEFEQYKRLHPNSFNEPGKEAKSARRRNSVTKIMWNFMEA